MLTAGPKEGATPQAWPGLQDLRDVPGREAASRGNAGLEAARRVVADRDNRSTVRQLRVPWVVLPAWLLWGVINVLRLGAEPHLSWNQALWYGLPDALVWAALTPGILYLARRHPVRRPHLASSLGFHLAAAGAFALLHAVGDATLADLRGFLFTGEVVSWHLVFIKVLRFGFHTNMLIYCLASGLAQTFENTRRLAQGEAREAELQARLSKARLANLESQLRPHFLFNTLNTVSGLMGGEPEAGRRVLRRLGELLRASLRSDPGQLITLREELELVRAYLEIENQRFADRLRVELEIADDPQLGQFPVPALIVQPLVENAITHGIARRPDGGTIAVRARLANQHLELQIEDDGPGLGEIAVDSDLDMVLADHLYRDSSGFGLGLNNTRQRLETLYGAKAQLHLEPRNVDGTGLRVSLRLPRTSHSTPSRQDAVGP